jgi:hypothetical protein
VEASRVVRRRRSPMVRQSAHRWQWGCQPYAPATLYPQDDFSYLFLWALVRLEGSGKLKKKFNGVIGTRTRGLPACGTVPEPAMLPRAPWAEEWVYTKALVRLEGLGKLKKNSMASSVLEPATFRLVAQSLNQLCYRVLPGLKNKSNIKSTQIRALLTFQSWRWKLNVPPKRLLSPENTAKYPKRENSS